MNCERIRQEDEAAFHLFVVESSQVGQPLCFLRRTVLQHTIQNDVIDRSVRIDEDGIFWQLAIHQADQPDLDALKLHTLVYPDRERLRIVANRRLPPTGAIDVREVEAV